MKFNKTKAPYRYREALSTDIYDTSDNSHIVRLIDALCDTGVGDYRKKNIVSMLRGCLATTQYNDLDALYGDTLGLPRLEEERYVFDTTKMTSEQQAECKNKDAIYRKRIYKYLNAINIGQTNEGIKLAAEASSGRKCYVFPNEDENKISVIAGRSDIAEPYYKNTATTGVEIALPPQPSRAGYVFSGWYDKPFGGKPIHDVFDYGSDVIFYARWADE